jgi:gliding motility-associated-like protein
MVSVTSAIQQQQALCTGTTIAFTNQSTGGSDYLWDFGDPLTGADTSSAFAPTYTYLDTGTFNAMLVANPGWPCADTSYATYEVHFPLDPWFPVPPITCMDQQPVVVQAFGNFDAAANITWDLGAFGVVPSVSDNPADLSFIQEGTHVVTVTVEEYGCTDSYVDTVTIHPVPVALFDGDTAGCSPITAQFIDLSTAWTPLSWNWDFGDGTGSSIQHPSHTYANPGAYDVRLEVMTSAGCIDTVSRLEPAFVEAWVQPQAGFMVTPPTVNVMEPTVLISDQSSGAAQWTYWIADTVITDASFLYDLPDAGEYVITQVVSTSEYCGDTAQFTVVVRDHLFYAPNAFTPDGDGTNDVFLPQVIGAMEYELSVFDRWGGLVFRTNDRTEGWTGGDLPNGTYVYMARIGTFGTMEQDHIGHVSLVR